MTPTTRYLTPGEDLQLETRRHEMVLLSPSLQVLVAVFVALAVPSTFSATVTNVLWLVTVPFLLRLAWRFAEWYVDRVVITNKRIFEISGLIVTKVAMMPLNRITDLTYQRPPIGRIFGYGEVILESAGQDQGLTKITHMPERRDVYGTLIALTLR